MKQESKIKIGIDIDDVIIEFMKNYLAFINKKNKTDFKWHNIKEYHLWKTEIYNSKEKAIKEMHDFLDSEEFDNLSLLPEVKESIELISNTHEIYFITARPKKIKEKTELFFKKEFPNNNFNVFYSGDIFGGKTKSEICEQIGISIMVEDNLTYALNCANKGIRVFLLDKPWNEHEKKNENIIRVNDWNEILGYLNKI